MTAPATRYLVTCVNRNGRPVVVRRFRSGERAAAWADREATRRGADVELLVMLPGARPVAVPDRAALAAAVGGEG